MSAVVRRVIGIDPGPTPGVVVLDTVDRGLVAADALQCTHGLLRPVLAALGADQAAVVLEQFVTRGRATPDQQLTRDQVGAVCALYPHATARAAITVKPWATDARLERAGLLGLTKGMRHARDAARHALYGALYAGALYDPMSVKWEDHR